MKEDLDFLDKFPKDRDGLYIVYELYTFDNLFRLLLKNNFDHEEALYFIFSNCSLSAYVFQERIHNKGYKKLSAMDVLPAELAACRAQLIYDLMGMV
jgi:serine/threonine protein kinase